MVWYGWMDGWMEKVNNESSSSSFKFSLMLDSLGL
jgi:hypothetical protein